MLAVFVAAGAFAGEGLPSMRVSHPAIADKETDDYSTTPRPRQDPEVQTALAEQVLAIDLDTLLGTIERDNGVDLAFSCDRCGSGFQFDFATPDSLTCTGCGAIVNERSHPPTNAIEDRGPKGDRVVLGYHNRGSQKILVGPSLRNARHQKIAEAARALARRYHDTRDERFAAYAVAILDKFAQVYPHWPVIEIRSFPAPARYFIEPERPYDHWVHFRWRHSYNYDVPYDLVFAYDLVYNSDEWKNRPGARERVETDLLRACHHFAWTALEDQGLQVSNLTGTLLGATIALGRTLGDPEMVYRAVHTHEQMMRASYHFDGVAIEGSRNYQSARTGRAASVESMLAGFEPPAGFEGDTHGAVLNGGSLSERIPVFERAGKILTAWRLPNGNPLCINDTDFPTSRREIDPETTAANIEWNAYGLFAIGRGRGSGLTQAYLRFSPYTRGSHHHGDQLSLILFGAGEELLSDIGYIHYRKNRFVANAAMAHNNVVVEYATPPEIPGEEAPDTSVIGTIERPKALMQLNRPSQDARSSLIAYDPGLESDKLVQVVAASVPGSPHENLQLRTRELLLIALDEDHSFLVDILRVQGGSRHNFILHPSSDEDVITESVSLELGAERPGTLAGENLEYGQSPPSSARGETHISGSQVVHKLRTAAADKDWTLTWLGKESEARLRVFMAGMKRAELWLGQSPTLRRADNNDLHADDFQNPHAFVRRPETGSGSTYVALYEPVANGDQSRIGQVKFDVGDDAGALAPVSASCVGAPGAQAIQPVYSVRAAEKGEPLWSYRQGTERGRYDLKRVLRTEDGDEVNGFVVAGRVPEESIQPGRWIRLLYGGGRTLGYCVERVTQQGGDTLIAIAGEPGFHYQGGQMEMLYFPFYVTPGECEIEVAPAAWDSRPDPLTR